MAPEAVSNPSRLQAFTLGDWLVEPRACRLSRGDTVIKLRPQLVDLLVSLARHAGGIELKDEILAEVWPGQYIAESGLSRCVAELRQFLQDDAQHPRYIETITKRGYRLVAPVVWLPPEPQDVAKEPRPESRATGHVADAVAPVDAMPALPPRSRLSIGRRTWLTVALALAAGTATVVVLLVRTPASVLTERDTVLLADVRNATGDRVFDDALRLPLAVNLEQAPFLHLLPQDAVRAALVRMGRSPEERVVGPLALDVCRREGAAVLLAGSIALLGSRYAVGIEAIACRTGEVVAGALAQVDRKEEVLPALERTATQIRRRLGESRASLAQHDVPLVRATTPSLEALRAVTLGDEARDHARIPEALSLYRQATDLDSSFALAWARRGVAALNLDLVEEAMPALRRAYELRDRVSQPERFYIEAHYNRNLAADPEKAIETLRAWKQMYPGSVIPPNNLASVLSRALGDYNGALAEAREAVRLARYSSIANANLVLALLGSGRIQEARQAVADGTSRGIDDRLWHTQLLNLALLDGDEAALDREIQRAAADPVAALLAARLHASSLMARGRLRRARQLWSDALNTAEAMGPARRITEIRLYQAEAEALVGDPRAARVAVEALLAADRGAGALANAAIVLALAGDRARAGALLDDLARQTAGEPVPSLVDVPVARALVEAGFGRADQAVVLLRPVARFERGVDSGLVPLGVRGLVQRAARQPLEAAAAFEQAIGLRAIAPASPWVPFARLGLARALRDAGDVSRSLAAYDAFLESWKDADADAPLLAVARRERAALAIR